MDQVIAFKKKRKKHNEKRKKQRSYGLSTVYVIIRLREAGEIGIPLHSALLRRAIFQASILAVNMSSTC